MKWVDPVTDLMTEKIPTCVLVKPDGKTLLAFGYEAENKYKELEKNSDHRDYYYFRKNEMALYNQQISENVLIDDGLGKSLSAIEVFSLAINYLAKSMRELLDTLMKKVLLKSDIQWVLTVPAIWSEVAKQFKREAAEDVEIDRENLQIVFEPEAALVYLKFIPSMSDEDLAITMMTSGTQYLILDAGRSTVDVTVHELHVNGSFKEIHKTSGGILGEILVINALKDCFNEIVGANVYERFDKCDAKDWKGFWQLFEMKIRQVQDSERNADIKMHIPSLLISTSEVDTGSSFQELIKKSKFSNEINIQRGTLILKSCLVKRLFDNSIKKTVSLIKSVLKQPEVKNTKNNPHGWRIFRIRSIAKGC